MRSFSSQIWPLAAWATLNCSLFMELVMWLPTVVSTQKAFWILSCFYLQYSSFLFILNIIELERTKEYRFISLNATG